MHEDRLDNALAALDVFKNIVKNDASGHAPQSWKNALAAGRAARSADQRGATFRIYKLKKDGTRSATPFDNKLYTEDDAKRRIDMLERNNPGAKFISIE